MVVPASTIVPVRTPDDAHAVNSLLAVYQDAPELRGTPVRLEAGAAALLATCRPPEGDVLLARLSDGRLGGCVALRRLEGTSCEVKRLFVDPAARGLGLGRALAEAAIAAAHSLGYRTVRLDTFPSMGAAIALYRSLGFRPTSPFGTTPGDGLLYFGLDLGPEATGRAARQEG